MDEVFKALNDPGRRRLLDGLFVRDGQTLAALCELLPNMTRFGVMSHLKVLEEAGLVVTRKEGRSRLHFLNPVPIRLVHDRWISKYAETAVGAMARLKAALEGGTMNLPDHVYTVYINAPQERVWQALTDGDHTVRYFYGTRVESTWEPGASVVYYNQDGTIAADGEVLAAEAPHRLETTFVARWDPDLAVEGPSRQCWILADANGATRLTVEYYDTPDGSKRLADFKAGLPYIVSGLKSVVETGRSLPAPS